MGIGNLFIIPGVSTETLLYTLLTIFLVLLWYYGTSSYNHWNDHKVYNVKPVFPFFGNLKFSDFLKSNLELIQVLYDRLSGKAYGGIYFLMSPTFFVRDPNLINKILITDFNHFVSRGFAINEDTDPLSKNLIHLNGKSWKVARHKLTAPFSSKKLKIMVSEMDNFAKKTIQNLSKCTEEPMKVVETTQRYMVDVVFSCAFGTQSKALEDENSEYYRIAVLIFSGYHFLIHTFTGFLFPNIHRFARMTVARLSVIKFFQVFTNQLLTLRKKNNERKDFMDTLINIMDDQTEARKTHGEVIVNEEQELLCDEEFVQANIFMFMAAGYDSSAKICSFCLYELASNQEIQEKAREEILRVLKKHNDVMSFESVCEMTYLEQVVSETNRKYPILNVIFRKCDKRYELPDGGIIEPGIPVIIPSAALHYDPKYYPEPNKFDPERFSEENKSSIKPGTYLPFGIGPRNCPAWQFAIIEIKVVVARILCNYNIKLHPSIQKPLKFAPRAFLLSPEKEILLNLHRKNYQ